MSRRADAVNAMTGIPGPVAEEHHSGVGPASNRGSAALSEPRHAAREASRSDGPAAWTLQTYLSFGAFAEAVPCARLHARLVAGECGRSDLVETVELLVSELVTNAVLASANVDGSWFKGRHASGRPPIRLWLQCDSDSIVISVWDGNDRIPQLEEPQPDDEHGRGLLLVESLSEECGLYRLEGATGKVVWARVSS